MFQKIWEDHLVAEMEGGNFLLYIDRHLIHEVTSPQAFDGLRINKRKIRQVGKTVATMDHNVPTTDRSLPVSDPISRLQMDTLAKNCAEFQVKLYDIHHPDQGIIHVIAPELGYTLLGTTIVCGDSHTATHGAFGALAFGIGTSEVEHVLSTQTLQQSMPKTMKIEVNGRLPEGSTAKDIVLAIIGKIGTAGGTGYVIEYAGDAIQALSMEGRMTLCNMSIEAGARAGMVAPDEKTFAYLKGKDFAPKGELWEKALTYWKSLPSDHDSVFDAIVSLDATKILPQVTWGTSPGMVTSIDGIVPDPTQMTDVNEKQSTEKALQYMGLTPGQKIQDIQIDKVFIGSCTNSRIEDLRAAAQAAKGKKVNNHVQAIVVPGSGRVKREAEAEGLDKIFTEAGFEWREAGCSMCLAMNADVLQPGERCASTSNRNFEGRQGKGSRTHLVSPVMAVAAAVEGHFTDIRTWGQEKK